MEMQECLTCSILYINNNNYKLNINNKNLNKNSNNLLLSLYQPTDGRKSTSKVIPSLQSHSKLTRSVYFS
ncbi:hypothetical protein MANES_02G001550v8 [Manihot esculenta]|uniref:Uncharacterized protein n=1 Tax=Manihot esculenta TaxID=3983 RepID=A0ACB7I457_MANES|nr:hypothetical protein MANES_02G001550v8 [Manihot esculenta]